MNRQEEVRVIVKAKYANNPTIYQWSCRRVVYDCNLPDVIYIILTEHSSVRINTTPLEWLFVDEEAEHND